MDVLQEILKWSVDRPAWQRDALRRLLENGVLTDTDIEELAEICKHGHGLSEVGGGVPLAKEHLPEKDEDSGRVTLESIYHHKGVNALAEAQTLTFGKNLTVVYGDNASGKSGYTRILKEACRARGAEEILGNVLSGTPVKPVVSIRYRIGDGESQEWTGEKDDEAISQVSVFDTHAAGVYLTEKTDVAFRPFGLDLFDKLVRSCRAVRQILEREQREEKSSAITILDFPEGTEVTKMLDGLSSLTDPEKVKEKATLSDAETAQAKLLEKQLVDLQAKDPVKLAKELSLRAKRFGTLVTHLKKLDATLSQETIQNIFASQKDTGLKAKAAEELRNASFPDGLLAGTGTEQWRELWDAARKFSTEAAYQEQGFPVTEDEARCVLCQQDLDHAAAERLVKFEAFVQSAVERDFQEARKAYAEQYKAFEGLEPEPKFVTEIINEVRIENDDLADVIQGSIAEAVARREVVITALGKKTGMPDGLPEYNSVTGQVETVIAQLDKRGEELVKTASPEQTAKIKAELLELQARQKLNKHLDKILAEIERKKKIAAYGLCINDTHTQGITSKSGALTKEVVTKQLQKSFAEELAKLRFNHIEVEIQEAGGDLGNFYHKVVLKRAPERSVPKIVSEGEARCLSIAAFFAELSTADEASAILFDDPVSSLDYKWREFVAARLVEEAKQRQVIIFTHDIVFLLQVHQFAADEKLDRTDQYLQRMSIGAGVSDPELPWIAMKVSSRIKWLRKAWQDADKLFRDNHIAAYDKEAAYIYGRLQEAWERGLEEVLLAGLVERFGVGVKTQHIKTISDITDADCDELHKSMTKCSKWRTGHDQAAAAKQDVPEPDELKADIEILDEWVSRIRKRRAS